jgi:hypothetical protein
VLFGTSTGPRNNKIIGWVRNLGNRWLKSHDRKNYDTELSSLSASSTLLFEPKSHPKLSKTSSKLFKKPIYLVSTFMATMSSQFPSTLHFVFLGMKWPHLKVMLRSTISKKFTMTNILKAVYGVFIGILHETNHKITWE